MNRLNPFTLFFYLVLLSCLNSVTVFSLPDNKLEIPINVDSPRITQSLNGAWKFFQGPHRHASKENFDSSRWQWVSVPHTWNTDIIKKTGYYKGHAWYRKTFHAASKLNAKRVFIRFEGALARTKVYLNGKEVGAHDGGYAAFAFEITDLIKFNSDNQLAVMVSNADNAEIVPTSDYLFTRFGGIYRPVELIYTDQVCISPIDYASPGVYLKQQNVTKKKAEVEIVTKLDNGYKEAQNVLVETSISDASGKIIWKQVTKPILKNGLQDVSQKAIIKNPHLWHGKKDPYLYSARIAIIKKGKEIDVVQQPLGLRYFHVDANEGFFLNDEYINLRGVSRHQEWEQSGSALTNDQHERDMALMEEMGVNTIRFAHYQQADLMYDITDKNGIVVWAEVPITPPYKKNNKKYKENCRQQIIELIRQNYNHPSILLWGMYNEVHIPIEHAQEFQKLMKTEDPTRLTTAASNKKLMDRHEVTDLIAWNKYFGWYNNPHDGIGAFMDGVHEKKPNLKIAVSEYGAGGSIAHQRQELTPPDPTVGQFYTEQYQCYVHEKNYKVINKRKYIWGKYIWNMFDFSWPIVDRGDAELLNHKGMITYDREVKKDVFYFYKANWSKMPVLYITSKRHIYRDNPTTKVKVYSNAKNVELTLNGEKINKKPTQENGAFVWEDLNLKKGENKVEVSADFKGALLKDTCTWVY
ncbi:hypothetical protein A8C32_07435 [Flavivirga aquatica]|uniref:Beta-galactosidase n=1 Tax=Flavivirga aquatica TaxID=1849968 RepID=A0A1E5SIR1_9FLAO|nr:glycoside hydrolase family 2 TIM barrel-domain containing protein [Flavivirga aquatica]OEJ99004.1 hypothetical protein A8C32_07435 [Flavivirga aquatica]